MYRNCKMNVTSSDKKVILELLSSCNLNCEHCFYRQSNEFHSSDVLSKEKVFFLIDQFAKEGVKRLVFTGGEPTLHPNFIDISKYAISKIDRVTVCTNGVILDECLENRVVDLNFAAYTVSVDSNLASYHDKFRGKKGALEKTLGFLKKLNDKNRNISIHIALYKDNADHIEDIIKFCRNFSKEIVVGSIYYDKLNISKNEIKKYNDSIKIFKNKYINHPEIILVGFHEYCPAVDCLDQKNVFTVNRKGQLVSCYWQKNGGKVIRDYI